MTIAFHRPQWARPSSWFFTLTLAGLPPVGLTLAGPEPTCAAADPTPATRDQMKAELEQHKAARPRLPMPPRPTEGRVVHNSLYRNYYLPESLRDGGFSRTPEPAFTLDPTFKVKLFWVTSRANACRYCLGHQEFKLRVARVTDDEIAALEGDPAKLEAKLAAGVRYTLHLTRQPHAIPRSMWEELNQHFTPAQQAELTLTIAGYNATNRWTGALNLPGEAHGEIFRPESTPRASEAATVDLSTFRTVTSATYREQKSRIVSQRPQPRPAWESPEAVASALAHARTRQARWPIADAATTTRLAGGAAHWQRALAMFPQAMAGRLKTLQAAATQGRLDSTTKAWIAWAAAREDRAWYSLDLALRQLQALGIHPEAQEPRSTPTAAPRTKTELVVAFTRQLTAEPDTISDADLAALRSHWNDYEIAEIVFHITNAAFFNRVTEAFQLPLDPTDR